MPNRRDFLRTTASTAASALGLGCIGNSTPRGDARTATSTAQQAPSFRGKPPARSERSPASGSAGARPGRSRWAARRTSPSAAPDEEQVEVTLTEGFWIGKYEVDAGAVEAGRRRASRTSCHRRSSPEGDDFPVYWTSTSHEAEAFCAKLTELARRPASCPTGWEFRLPTEAQWEYACRAGTDDGHRVRRHARQQAGELQDKPYNGAEDGPALGKARQGRQLPGERLGHPRHARQRRRVVPRLVPRAGCRAAPTPTCRTKAPAWSTATGLLAVRRGGAWIETAWACRSAFRLPLEPERRYDHIGFRVFVVERA